MNVEGRSAIVTGAAGGIGEAIAQRLLERGASSVVLTDLDADRLDVAAERLAGMYPNRVDHLAGDVTDDAHLRALTSRDVDLYFNLMYHQLDDALRLAPERILVGQTADVFKARLGCRPSPHLPFNGHRSRTDNRHSPAFVKSTSFTLSSRKYSKTSGRRRNRRRSASRCWATRRKQPQIRVAFSTSRF